MAYEWQLGIPRSQRSGYDDLHKPHSPTITPIMAITCKQRTNQVEIDLLDSQTSSSGIS